MLADPIFALVSLFLLGGLFFFSAWQKFADLASFRNVLMDYSLPAETLPLLTLAIPLIEVSIAVAAFVSLIVPITLPVFAGAVLLAVYTATLSLFYFTGRKIDCGCHFGEAGEPVNGWHVVRNLMLIAVSLSYFLPQSDRLLVWVDYFTAAVGAVMILLSLSIIETLRHNSGHFDRVRRVN